MFRCNGEGVEVGAYVAVRERSKLEDGGFYTGVVVGVEEDSGNPRDVVFVMSKGLLYATRRHCVYATKDNLETLKEEVYHATDVLEEHVEDLDNKISNAQNHMRSAELCPHCLARMGLSSEVLNRYAEAAEQYKDATELQNKYNDLLDKYYTYADEINEMLYKHYGKEDEDVEEETFEEEPVEQDKKEVVAQAQQLITELMEIIKKANF